ncbi:GCN5-like 1 [Powellomyces hirtus]|nr:GCN5-like 1 [Powellomyces hirtus]
MLSKVLRDHQQKQAADRLNADRLHREAIAGVTALTDVAACSTHTRVAAAFTQQREIEHLTQRLAAAAAQHARQSRAWIALVHGVDAALRNVGDVASWAGAVQRDVRDVCVVLDNV